MKYAFNFYIILLLSFIVLLTLVSCKKEDPIPKSDLPPLTHTGEMTFGCYVEGLPWIAQVPPFQAEFIHLSGSYSISKKRFVLSALKMKNDAHTEQIGIVVNNFTNTNSLHTNDLKQYPFTSFNFICKDLIKNIDFEIDSSSKNEIKIVNFDLEKRIVSGQFNFTVIAIHCPEEKVELKDGRFDLQFSITE